MHGVGVPVSGGHSVRRPVRVSGVLYGRRRVRHFAHRRRATNARRHRPARLVRIYSTQLRAVCVSIRFPKTDPKPDLFLSLGPRYQ